MARNSLWVLASERYLQLVVMRFILFTPDSAYPMDSDKATVSDALEKRGRTATWENQNY